MAFRQIDREHWARKEYFDHYFSQVPCTYSAGFRLNITNLKKQGQKLYPTMLYHIAAQVNSQEEFRTALDSEGRLGVYDQIHPCYTIFYKGNSTFSNLWTEYTPNYEAFCEAYRKDMAQYGPNLGLEAKPNLPPNTFPVSMLPWASFKGFNLNLQKGMIICCPSSPWENTLKRGIKPYCRWQFRYTMQCVTAFTCAVLCVACRNGWTDEKPQQEKVLWYFVCKRKVSSF